MKKTYWWNCDCCGIKYEITSSQYHRLNDGRQKHGFCSVECKSKSQQRRVIVNCANCNAEITRTEYQANKNENAFCCSKCKTKYLYKTTREKRVCEVCGTEYETKKISNQRFCCPDCANEYQKSRVGELNAKYRRVKMPCDWCGKEIAVKQSKINQENHFCSRECQREWYAKDFSQRDEFKNIIRSKILERMNSGLMPNLDTKPQLLLNQILDELSIQYIREYPLDFYSLDNYLIDSGLMIEVQGDYYHASPLKFTNPSDRQVQIIGKDKAKHSFMLNKYNIQILYIWEKDTYERLDVCKALVRAYVDNNGILQNYNSFNYYLDGEELKLNDNLIFSYQEL